MAIRELLRDVFFDIIRLKVLSIKILGKEKVARLDG